MTTRKTPQASGGILAEAPNDLRDRVLAEVHRTTADNGNHSKEVSRALHAPSVEIELRRRQTWIRRQYPKYSNFFANGDEVEPTEIRPTLLEVTEPWQVDLFRLARLTWSLPYTKGYGRRLRFIVLDTFNNKLMGILAMQSPPLDFPARDRLFSYPPGAKVALVNQTMDIYTLGALPPYSQLLGGKLIAFASASNEVQQAYQHKYSGRLTVLDKQELPARLVALTTTSAFGRSSIYNRLVYNGRLVAQSIGYTQGYGSFHLAPLYPEMREFLEQQGVSTRGGFGVGPRIIWQTHTRALQRLGLPRGLLNHGIRREAFLFSLASNLKDYLDGNTTQPTYYDQPFGDLADWWRTRWLLARAQRVGDWRRWNRREIEQMLFVQE